MVSITPAFALTELDRVSIAEPKLVNAFGTSLGNSITVGQQVQVASDIRNNQEKSQDFLYLVQIKDEIGYAVSVGWISGQLTPNQKFSPSLSWIPKEAGEYTAEIFVWEGIANHKALAEYTMLQISIS
jgi:hypothetical protein